MSEKKVDVEVTQEDIDKAMGNPQKQAQLTEMEQINLMMRENMRYSIINVHIASIVLRSVLIMH